MRDMKHGAGLGIPITTILMCTVLPAAGQAPLIYGGPAFNGSFGIAAAVTDSGVAVGTVQREVGGISAFRAAVWSAGGITELAGLVTQPGGANWTMAWDMNASGLVVGKAENFGVPGVPDQALPVMWSTPFATPTMLDPLGNGATARAVNNAGIAAGELGYDFSFTPTSGASASIAQRWGTSPPSVTPLGHLGMFPDGYTNSSAQAINDSGVAVGSAMKFAPNGDSLGYRAVRWNAGQTSATELGHLGTDASGFVYSEARKINAGGTIIGFAESPVGGFRPVRWDPASTVAVELGNLGTELNGNTYALPVAINDSGTIVGEARMFDASGNGIDDFAVRWDAGQLSATLLEHFGQSSKALDINDSGLIVGWARKITAGQPEWRATYWNPDGSIVDLNDLIDPSSGWILREAHVVSNTGWIAGLGEFDPDGPGEAGATNRLFLVQVPEPTSALIWNGVLLTLLRRRLRRDQSLKLAPDQHHN